MAYLRRIDDARSRRAVERVLAAGRVFGCMPVALRLADHITDEFCALVGSGLSKAKIAAKCG